MTSLAQLSRQLDNALRALAAHLQQNHNSDDGYEFSVTVAKNYHDSAVKITYSAGKYYGGKTSGNDAGAVILEWHRREGWNSAHEPMALLEGPAQAAEAGSAKAIADDEIPF